MPSRRQYLATVGVGLSLAGCLSNRDPSRDPTETAPSSPEDTETASSPPPSSSQTPVEMSDIEAHKAVVYESVMGSGGVLAEQTTQYVVASVERTGSLDPDAFSLVAGDQSWGLGLPETAGGENLTVEGHGNGPLSSPIARDKAYLAFTLPSPLDVDAADIRYDGETRGEWPLSADALDVLNRPAPAYELDSLTVPDSLSQGETLTVSLTATNVSDVDGRFLAAVYWPTRLIADDDESHVVDRSVAAGETVEASLDLRTTYTAHEDGPVPLQVRGHVEASREVLLQNVSTPT